MGRRHRRRWAPFAEPLLDAGYVDSGLLLESQAQPQVTVIGPVAPDHCWQALTPDAFRLSRFGIDWQAKRVTCPQGHPSQKWSQTHDQPFSIFGFPQPLALFVNHARPWPKARASSPAATTPT